MAEKYFSTLTGKELDDALKAALNVKSTIQTELQTAKDSGEFDGPPGEDGMNPYKYAIQNGYEYAESTFIIDFLAALSSEEYEEVFMGEDLTEFDAYRDAFSAEKAVFHRDNNGLVYIASAADTAQISFYCIDKDGAVRCAALNSKNEWIYYTVSGGSGEANNVFVGDKTTTLAEFYEAGRNKKVCFMIRPWGGSGDVTWTMHSANSSSAHFFTVNSTGVTYHGILSSAGNWTVSSKQDIDLTGYAKTEDIPKKPEDIGADPAGTAAGAVAGHNTDTDSHADLRLELKAITDRLNAFFDSDNQTLDELSEIVAYITSNKALIDSITTSKVSVADIINNLTTNVANKPLSAAQGVVLKSLVDGLQSGKLDASALTAAINTALAQAKNSGEFDGATGRRGAGLLPITTAPSSYTTAVNGLTPAYRISLSTVKTQASATEVYAGDTIRYSYYHYPVIYVDASYVYCGTRVSIRGSTGAPGTTPVKGTDYYTDADKEEMVAAVIAALPDTAGVGY